MLPSSPQEPECLNCTSKIFSYSWFLFFGSNISSRLSYSLNLPSTLLQYSSASSAFPHCKYTRIKKAWAANEVARPLSAEFDQVGGKICSASLKSSTIRV